MAIRNMAPEFCYGLGDNLIQLAPRPIVAQRDPTTNDLAQLGTIWVNEATGTIFGLASISSGSANWTSTPAAGATTVTSLDITGAGGLDVQNAGSTTTISSSTINFDNAGALTTISGSLTVAGTTTITGDLDLSSAALIDLTSTLDAAPSIYLHANGGTSEQIRIHADQGTAVNAIELDADDGGITLVSGLASADAINLSATGGGIDIDGALQVNIASSQNAADALVLTASAGGIDITATGAAAGEDIDIIATGSSVNITSTENVADSIVISSTNGGIDITATGAAAGEDIDITASSSINITSTEDVAQAIYIRANAGTSETIQIHADQGTGAASVNIVSDVGGITLSGGLATADAINIVSSNAGGGIDIDAGTAGIAIDSTGAFSIDGAAASNVTVTGAGIDLTLSSAGGSVLVESTEDAALAIRLHANGGTSETIQIHSDQGTGANSINLVSDVGGITLTATGLASADAINLEATAGGIDMDAALQINITSSQNAADAIRILSSAGGIDVDAVGAAGEDIVITNTGGSISLVSTEATADAIVLNASDAAGGIDLLTGGGEISISSSGNVAMVPATATVAGTSLTINARVGVATFTGLTTAAGATEDFTITNSALGAGDGVFVTVSNKGTNDADMTLEGVITQTAGTLTVHTKNNGAAALNGDVVITFWIIN